MRSLLHKLVCALRGHAWKVEMLVANGYLTAIPRCRRCGRVDVDGIRETVWNRTARRRWHRELRRSR
jgi:hypothetical protein